MSWLRDDHLSERRLARRAPVLSVCPAFYRLYPSPSVHFYDCGQLRRVLHHPQRPPSVIPCRPALLSRDARM